MRWSTNNGNQLTGVEDASGNVDGFVNGVTEETEYGYDANGNMVFEDQAVFLWTNRSFPRMALLHFSVFAIKSDQKEKTVWAL